MIKAVLAGRDSRNLVMTYLSRKCTKILPQTLLGLLFQPICFLFHSKKRTNFQPTVASVLSAGNPQKFQSGYAQFGETGWWRLVDAINAPEYQPKSSKPTITIPSKLFLSFLV